MRAAPEFGAADMARLLAGILAKPTVTIDFAATDDGGEVIILRREDGEGFDISVKKIQRRSRRN